MFVVIIRGRLTFKKINAEAIIRETIWIIRVLYPDHKRLLQINDNTKPRAIQVQLFILFGESEPSVFIFFVQFPLGGSF